MQSILKKMVVVFFAASCFCLPTSFLSSGTAAGGVSKQKPARQQGLGSGRAG